MLNSENQSEMQNNENPNPTHSNRKKQTKLRLKQENQINVWLIIRVITENETKLTFLWKQN